MTSEGPRDQVFIMRHLTPCPLASLLLALVACTGTTVNDGGSSGAPTTLASQLQVPPARMFSDGIHLFWSTGYGNTGISSMPVDGGAISTVIPNSGGVLVGVDDTSIYYLDESGALYRSAKGGGGSATLITEPGASTHGVAISGGRAYWVESPNQPPGSNQWPITVKSAPLQGGAVSEVATFTSSSPEAPSGLGVTATTAFISGLGAGLQQLASFPLSSGVPDGGLPATVSGAPGCEELDSDSDAVYCIDGDVLRITSEGATSKLGTILFNTGRGGVIAHDDSYVYWVDSVTVGTITQVPKTGGTATVLARDTGPIAIAVDSHAVYWSDDGGNIMRLAK